MKSDKSHDDAVNTSVEEAPRVLLASHVTRPRRRVCRTSALPAPPTSCSPCPASPGSREYNTVSPMAFQRVVQLRYRDRNFVYYFSNRRTALCLLQVYLSTIILSVCNNDYSISYFIYWSIVKLLPAYCLLHTDIKCVIPNILFSSHSIMDFLYFCLQVFF